MTLQEKLAIEAKHGIDSKQEYYPTEYKDQYGNMFTSKRAYDAVVGFLAHFNLGIYGKLTDKDVWNLGVMYWAADDELRSKFQFED